MVFLGTRKLIGTFKRKVFESSVGKMGCRDPGSGEEVSDLIVRCNYRVGLI